MGEAAGNYPPKYDFARVCMCLRANTRIQARALGTPSRVNVGTAAISAIIVALGIVVPVITTAIGFPF